MGSEGLVFALPDEPHVHELCMGRLETALRNIVELVILDQLSANLDYINSHQKDVANVLVAVGQRGRLIGEEARAVGMPDSQVVILDTVDEAITTLNSLVAKDDFILVKGSRGARMEQVVEELRRLATQ